MGSSLSGKQGCVLSPIFFSMFINDDINNTNCGTGINGKKIATLLYADDVVVLADNPVELQLSLDVVGARNINPWKNKAIHFRNKKCMLCQSQLKLGDIVIDYSHDYKYLGCWINKFLDTNESLGEVFAKANSVLEVIIAKSKWVYLIMFLLNYTKLVCHTVLIYGAQLLEIKTML